MKLSAPKFAVFLVSVIIAAIGFLAVIGNVSIVPVPAFWLMAIAYVVLAVGCLIRGA